MDGTRLLLGHDNELVTPWWKQDNEARHFFQRVRFRAPVFLLTLLFIPLTIFFILYLQWHSAFKATKAEVAEHPDPVKALGPERDLKFLLHPQDHVSRDPGISTTEVHRFNLRDVKGSPLAEPLPVPGKTFMIYTAIEVWTHLNNIPHGFINHTFWEPQNLPLVSLDREIWDSHQLVPWTGSEPTWVELTINNIDANGHPFHLHGFDFHVITSYEGKGGWDYYNPFTPTRPPLGGPFNLENPIHKDTVYVPPWGYVVIRFLADNEGIWALHCHVLWHQGSGMSMAFQVLGDEQKGFSDSIVGLSAENLCMT